MKITFNLMHCGLGNNGGSLTIIKSANALIDLGHDVFIIDTLDNQNTWTKLRAKHIVVKKQSDIPDSDVVIATGYDTVAKTLKLPKRCGLKCHWIRAWELWKMDENEIVDKILNTETIKLVNSIGLREKLEFYGYDSYIVRPGNDLDDIVPQKKKKFEFVLGGLFHNKHKTKRVDWVTGVTNFLRKKHTNMRLWMFGATNKPYNLPADKYFSNPDIYRKNLLYNYCDVWLSPSSLEGLHIVPQEAMLATTPVVTTNAPLSGTKDYIIHEETGLISEDNIFSFRDHVERLVFDSRLRHLMGQQARQMIIQLGDRHTNMKRMVSLFKEISN